LFYGQAIIKKCFLKGTGILNPGLNQPGIKLSSITAIQYPVSSIQYPASSIKYPVSSNQYQPSSIQYHSIQYPATSIQYSANPAQNRNQLLKNGSANEYFAEGKTLQEKKS